MNLPLTFIVGGTLGVIAAGTRIVDTSLKPLGFGLIGAGLFALASPAFADQHLVAADNARVDCTASASELTRISLIGDAFASVSKISTGYPYSDFTVTNEPIRGDIYISVPQGYAPRSINFFATSKAGYVYKFVCDVAPGEPQQVFVSNPALAEPDAAAWEQETPIEDSAVRLIEAMAADRLIDGYQIRHRGGAPIRAGNLLVRQISEYRGKTLLGKVLRLENRGANPLTIEDSDLGLPGTLAVSVGSDVLAPGAATSAWLVLRNGS